MADTVVGLMIVEDCVRAAEVRRPGSKNPTLVRYGEAPLPAGAAGDSEVIDADAVALALRQLWTESGFSTKRVVLGLGNRRILVRDHTAPRMPLPQIRRALPFQVQDMLPVPVDEAILDFYPLADGPEGVRGLLVAAVADMVTRLIETVRKAKLDVEAVDLAPFGLVRAAARHIDPRETVLLAHVGAHTSYLTVVRNNAPELVRIVPGGVPVAFNESGRHRAELEHLVTVGGLADVSPEVHTAEETRRVEEFAMRVRSTVDFYVERHADVHLDGLYLCGEGAYNDQVLPALDRMVGLPGRLLTIDDVLRSAKQLDTQSGCLSMVTPTGLALRSSP